MGKRFEKADEYTRKYKKDLLPCRACGSTDIRIVSDRELFPPRNVWGVVCTKKNCECTGTSTSVKDVIRRWNELNSKPIENFNKDY